MNIEENSRLKDLKIYREKLAECRSEKARLYEEITKCEDKLFENQQVLFKAMKEKNEALIKDIKQQEEELFGRKKEIWKEIDRMHLVIAKIEVEYMEKIQALFYGYNTNSEKLDSTNKELDLYKKKLEKHSDEIYYLNSKVQAF